MNRSLIIVRLPCLESCPEGDAFQTTFRSMTIIPLENG